MAEQTKTKRPKTPPTPRQLQIKALVDKGRDKRSDQDNARLSQLKKEEARSRFLRLAASRTQKTIDALTRLGQCGNRNSYEYTQEEAEKIFLAVQGAVATMSAAFQERKAERSLFQL